MAMWKRIAIFYEGYMQTDFKLYKVDMKYIRNLHNIDDKMFSVSSQTGQQVFFAGKGGKGKLTTRIQNYFRKIKWNRIKKRITANPHMLEEVVNLLKREYGATGIRKT